MGRRDGQGVEEIFRKCKQLERRIMRERENTSLKMQRSRINRRESEMKHYTTPSPCQDSVHAITVPPIGSIGPWNLANL